MILQESPARSLAHSLARTHTHTHGRSLTRRQTPRARFQTGFLCHPDFICCTFISILFTFFHQFHSVCLSSVERKPSARCIESSCSESLGMCSLSCCAVGWGNVRRELDINFLSSSQSIAKLDATRGHAWRVSRALETLVSVCVALVQKFTSSSHFNHC